MATKPTNADLEEYAKLLEELARRKRVEECRQSIMKFARTYFTDRIVKTESPPFHYELMSHVEEALNDKTHGHYLAIAAPRSHSKSMLVSVIGTLFCLYYHLYEYIVIISSKQEIAAQLLATIKNEILNNDKLKADFGDMYSRDTWNQMKVICSNGVLIQAAGAGDALRGFNHNGSRPGVVFLDDLEKDPEVLSASYRDQMQDWLNSTCLPLGDPGKSHFIYVGTLLHQDSVLRRVQKDDPRFKPFVYSALKSYPKNMDKWEIWAEILRERLINDDGEEASAFVSAQKARQYFEENKDEMTEGAEVLWEERMGLTDLMVIWATNRKSFLTEFQQSPRDDSQAIFTNFTMFDELPSMDDMDIYGSVDPSLGKTARSDPSCIVTVGKHKKTGVIYVIDVSTKRRSPDAIIEDIIRLANVYPYKMFAVETVAFQEMFRDQLQTRAQLEGIYLPVKSVKPLSDKKLRISSLEPLLTNGLVRFGRQHASIIEELRDFPTGTHDDQADALEMAVALTYKQKRTFVFDAV